ncbi:hypothetical protein AB0I77_33105 [Streptomyces sp. NPDC050619]|uniref:hypothetical protein n=1 Tax=Streptomyces sp. NPDC050619 TaxID=3157214 RepID=UPI003417D35B
MSLQRGRLVRAKFLSGGIFLGIYSPADDHFFGLVIDLPILVATGILLLTVRTWAHESATEQKTKRP